jgi:hypothetical protein
VFTRFLSRTIYWPHEFIFKHHIPSLEDYFEYYVPFMRTLLVPGFQLILQIPSRTVTCVIYNIKINLHLLSLTLFGAQQQLLKDSVLSFIRFCVLYCLTVITWCLSVRASLHMRRVEKPTRCHWMVYCTYDMLNMFRAILCPSSGARDCMCVITAYGVWCFGCWLLEVRCRAAGYASGMRDVARLQSSNIPHSGRIA